MLDYTDQAKHPRGTVVPLSHPVPNPYGCVHRTVAQDGTPPAIRVLVVDDHPLLRHGITRSVQACTNLEVVSEAKNGEDAIRYCAEAEPEHFPDVVLMDLMMPGMGGVAAIQALHTEYPTMRIVALTSLQEGSVVEEALQAGAIGYLTKDAAAEEVANAIVQAHRGAPVLAPTAAQALVRTVVHRPPPLGQDLTDRERKVLALLVEGLSNKEIAERLTVTLATVKFHLRSIRSKLGTSSRTETVVVALKTHLVATPGR